jgi:hypothetical protein
MASWAAGPVAENLTTWSLVAPSDMMPIKLFAATGPVPDVMSAMTTFASIFASA